MGDIGGVAKAGADIVAANIQAKNQQAVAQQQADAQQRLYESSFKNQTSYIQNQEQGGRNAISQAAQQFGNPYVNAQSSMRAPEPMAAPSAGHFGGGVYNGSGYATGLSGASSPMTTPTPRPQPTLEQNGMGSNVGGILNGLSGGQQQGFGGGESRSMNGGDAPQHPGLAGGGLRAPHPPGMGAPPDESNPGMIPRLGAPPQRPVFGNFMHPEMMQ